MFFCFILGYFSDEFFFFQMVVFIVVDDVNDNDLVFNQFIYYGCVLENFNVSMFVVKVYVIDED